MAPRQSDRPVRREHCQVLFRAKRKQLVYFRGLLPQNLALTVLYVPYSLGLPEVLSRPRRTAPRPSHRPVRRAHCQVLELSASERGSETWRERECERERERERARERKTERDRERNRWSRSGESTARSYFEPRGNSSIFFEGFCLRIWR